MTKNAIPILLLLLVCLWITSCEETGPGTSYFVSVNGDDSDSGLSPRKAWQSIDRVNEQDFEPGDRILFQGGETFTGTLMLSAEDSGIPSSRLIVASYGEGRGVVAGEALEALKADSCQFLTIENLELRGAGRKKGNCRDGLLIYQCDGVV
ncbi:MAG: hypothetical protein U9R49_06745, partial [Bacteroidota bacterium]|nr:hypothetical protein [Bacteroidota bacterium]